MDIQVIVTDDIDHYSVIVAVAPGRAADLFRQRFQAFDDVPCFLNDYLEGPLRDPDKIREYQGLRSRFPEQWLILGRLWSSQYELMDWLVEEFDAEVAWPAYQANLEQLRARRERLRQWRATRGSRGTPFGGAQHGYPPQVRAAFSLLGCSPGAGLQAAQRAYKRQCLKHHPDTGGSHEAMTRLNRAMELVRDFLLATPTTH